MYKVLIVDDEADILEIAGARLEAADFEVEKVDNAEDAFKKAKEFKPDLILLDIRMPGINGTEALLDFQKIEDLEKTKIAFFTNLSIPWPGVTADNEKVAKELGAVKYLDKSKDMDNLAEKVKEILEE